MRYKHSNYHKSYHKTKCMLTLRYSIVQRQGLIDSFYDERLAELCDWNNVSENAMTEIVLTEADGTNLLCGLAKLPTLALSVSNILFVQLE